MNKPGNPRFITAILKEAYFKIGKNMLANKASASANLRHTQGPHSATLLGTHKTLNQKFWQINSKRLDKGTTNFTAL